MLINGKSVPASGGGTWNLINPATEESLGDIAFGDATDAVAAIDAASEALEAWTRLGPYKRAAILHRAADLLVERADVNAAITSAVSILVTCSCPILGKA